MIAATQTRIVSCTTPIHRINGINQFSKSAFGAPRVVPTNARHVTTKAIPDVSSFIFELAEGAPGTVDAPIGVVAGLAIVVSAASLLFFSLGLKPGEWIVS